MSPKRIVMLMKFLIFWTLCIFYFTQGMFATLPAQHREQGDRQTQKRFPRGLKIPEKVKAYWTSHKPVRSYNPDQFLGSIDWSGDDSPVKNQQYCGSCWAFVAIALVENISNENDLSEQVIVSCAPGDCGGGWYWDALEYIKNYGVPPESCYPYISQNGNCSDKCDNPPYLLKITSFTPAWGLWGENMTVNDLKAQLQQGPLCVAMLVPEDGTFDSYTGGVYDYNGGYIPWEGNGHAVLLVGYNDNGQYFKAKNSWGRNWGENGYFRISYDDVTDDVKFGMYAATASGAYIEGGGGNCSITVNSPNGGEIWAAGSTHAITWASSNTSGNVKIQYSTNGGGTWTTIVNSTNDDGSYNWHLPSVSSTMTQCKVRILDANDSNCKDTSDGNFTIEAGECQITVTSPNGGEIWATGSTHQITWTSNGTSGQVRIKYTTNGGASWNTIINSTNDDGSYSWHLPTLATTKTQCKVRISDVNGNNCSDISNSFFTIQADCQITVIEPNGGEIWQGGSTHNITWTSSGTSGNVKIQYSKDGGSTWSNIINSTNDDGSYSWNLPNVSSTKSQCKVRIADVNDSNCKDVSDSYFTIQKQCQIILTSPNGGELWDEGSTQTITWNSNGTSGQVKLKYTANGGSNWHTIASNTPDDGSYSWILPDVVGDKSQCKVKIMDRNNTSCSDQSDNYFTIKDVPEQCIITVISPNGGENWSGGSIHSILWTSQNTSGNVRVDYSLDGGVNWYNIVGSTPDDGAYNWTLPAVTEEKSSSLIKVSDVSNSNCFDLSNGNFTISPVDTGLQGSLYINDITGSVGSTITVEISIDSNANPIDAFGIKLSYCSEKLSYLQTLKGDLTASFQNLQANGSISGLVVIGGYHTTPIPANSSGTIARVQFQVIQCTEGETCALILNNPVDDFTGFNLIAGTFSCGNSCDLGDVNMDGVISPGDALCAFQIYLNGGILPSGECNNECALSAADVSCTPNGVTPADGLYIFQQYLNGESPPLDCDNGTVLSVSNEDTKQMGLVRIPGKNSQLINLALQVNNARGMKAFGLNIGFPDDILQLVEIKASELTQQWEAFGGRETSDGIITIGGYHSEAVEISDSTALAELTFKILRRVEFIDLWFYGLKDDLERAVVLEDVFRIPLTFTDVYRVDENVKPLKFSLEQNYPNPFNSETEIVYELSKTTSVKVIIYNFMGQKVKTLVDHKQSRGRYIARWNGKDDSGKDLPSGIYVCKLETQEFIAAKKLILVR